jgi:hypothetical protein
MLVIYLHTMAQSAMELLALIGPAAVIFGAGTLVVLMPIIRAGGERYQHKEHVPGELPSNGHGHKKTSKAERPAEPETTSARRER